MAGRATQLDRQVIGLERVAHPEFLDNVARGARADGAERVLHRIFELHLLAIVEEAGRILDDLGVERIGNLVARLAAVVLDLVGPIDGDQKRIEIKIVQVGRATADLREKVGTADHLVERTGTDRGEDLAHFGGVEGDEVDHLVGRAGELGAQALVLGADTHRAGVGLALAHHDTAHGDQRRCADAVFLGPHHRRHDDIAPGAQAAIGAKGHAVAQVVHRQNLMRLGEAHLPRQARVFDRGRGRGAGAAVVARDQDHVGLGLGHARRNRADARRSHELDRHLAARVDLFEIVDQLREVFDRVDVVVRRRRDQGHAFGRMPQTRDQLGNLHPRKLAALAGLGPLGDLDLKLFAGIEVFGGHTEAARGHLLDLGAGVVAIRQRMRVCRILATLAAIGFRADAVHGDVEGHVCLGRKRPKAHARRYKPLADRGDAFHLFKRHGVAQRLDRQQVAQVDRRIVLHRLGILLPKLERGAIAGRLQEVHGLRFPSVLFADPAGLVEAADGKHVLLAEPALGVDLLELALDAVQADAGDARLHSGEILGHHRAAEAHGLEIQAAAIGGQNRNPHLRHDLEKARVDGIAIAADGIGERSVDQAAIDAVGNRILREIGVNRRRAAADQNGEIMRVDALGGTHVERGKGPQALAGKPAMHRAGGKDHRHPDLAFALLLVSQNQMARARAHSILGFGTNALEPLMQGLLIVSGLDGAVDHRHQRAKLAHHLLKLGVGDERAFQNEDLGLARILVEHVLEVSEAGLEAHHPALAKRVDRRVGDLAEVLPEEMAQRAILAGKNRWRGIIAHRGDHFLAVLGHRREHLLKLFDAIACCDLALAELAAREQRLFWHIAHQRVEIDNLLDPIAERLGSGELVLDFGVAIKAAVFHIDGDHLAGAKCALLDHGGFVDRDHARLGTSNQQALAGDDIAHRAQAVTVKSAANPAAVGHGKGGGSVPRLHHGVAVGIHILPSLRHLDRLLRPRLGDHHRFRHRRRAAGADENLEHGIQSAGVRRARRNDRFDIFGHLAKGARGHADLVAPHPVDVSLERVDLAIVGQHAEWLRQRPLREGVGRIALVIDREGAFETGVEKVGIKLGDLFGQHHALVNDRPAAQRAEVEAGDLRRDGGFLDPATDDVELALELVGVDVFLTADQDLLDLGAGRVGLVTKAIGAHRNVAPAIDIMAHPQDFGFNDRAAALLSAEIGARQKDLTNSDELLRIRLMPRAADLIIEERDRDLDVNARAVAGFAIGIHSAAVPDRLQRRDAFFDNPARGYAVDRDNKAHAAGRMLVLFAPEAVLVHPLALALFGFNPGLIIDGHGDLLIFGRLPVGREGRPQGAARVIRRQRSRIERGSQGSLLRRRGHRGSPRRRAKRHGRYRQRRKRHRGWSRLWWRQRGQCPSGSRRGHRHPRAWAGLPAQSPAP